EYACQILTKALGQQPGIGQPSRRPGSAPSAAAAAPSRKSGGALISDLTARTGVLAVLRSIDCRQDAERSANLMEQDHVLDDASRRKAGKIGAPRQWRVLERGGTARSRRRRPIRLFCAHDRRLLPAVVCGASAATR